MELLADVSRTGTSCSMMLQEPNVCALFTKRSNCSPVFRLVEKTHIPNPTLLGWRCLNWHSVTTIYAGSWSTLWEGRHCKGYLIIPVPTLSSKPPALIDIHCNVPAASVNI